MCPHTQTATASTPTQDTHELSQKMKIAKAGTGSRDQKRRNRVERMTTCPNHGNARIWFDDLSPESIDSYDDLNRLRPEIKNLLVPTTAYLIGFSGEIIWLIWQIQLLVTIGDEEHSASSWMNFVVVRSPSPYNGIIGGPRVRKLQAVPSTAHGMLKISVEGGNNLNKQQTKETGQATDRIQEIHEEVEKLMEAGIIKEVHYHDWLSNPVMVKKHDGSWRMCVDFKDINKACPKDGYPLPEIDWKVESLATYQRLVDKAFHKQIGRNLKLYVDELVMKSRTEEEITRDIEEMFKTLREINMKLNPKKCTFGIEEGIFLGCKVNTRGQKVCPEKEDVVLCLPSLKFLKDVQMLNGKLASLNRPRVSVKGKILADFIVERPKEDSLDTLMAEEEKFHEPWILFTNGSSCTDGSRAGPILTNPEGMEFTYALRFKFDATNNEAKYEAPIVGLKIAEQMGVKNLQANVDSQLVANQVNETYVVKETNMIRYMEKVKGLTNSFKAFFIKQIPKKKTDALSKIASTSFAHLSKKVLVEELKEKSISTMEVLAIVKEEGDAWMTPIFNYLKDETLPADAKKKRVVKRPLQANYVPREIHEEFYSMYAVAIDYFTKWIEAKSVATITGNQIKKFAWDNIVCRFRLPEEIISDNRKKFRDDPFKDWCEKLCIRQLFAFVKHLQTNGLVERANHSLGEGINARSKNWMEDLPHILWAHHTMIKSSNGDTLFSLTYRTKAVISAEIGMPTLRTVKFPLPEGTSHCLKKNATARKKLLPLPEVGTAIIVKEKS
nr:reverse transcriptase domain-containing protein [Tanacetum cinerariifolium]